MSAQGQKPMTDQMVEDLARKLGRNKAGELVFVRDFSDVLERVASLRSAATQRSAVEHLCKFAVYLMKNEKGERPGRELLTALASFVSMAETNPGSDAFVR